MVLKTLVAALSVVVALPSGGSTFDAEDALQRSHAAYAALTAYADSGTVVEENGSFRDKFAFRTYFTRQPRNLFLDFVVIGTEYNGGHKIPGGRGLVFWMENGFLQTYDTQTREHLTFPEDGGQQVYAISSGNYGTKGVSVIVPSLLYTKAGMMSVIQATEEATAAGTEDIDGHPCLKVTGIERWRYPSGKVTGVRPVTIWIDAKTYLIRKIHQDTPKGMPRGAVSQRITTYRPYANPSLEAGRFHYTVPDE